LDVKRIIKRIRTIALAVVLAVLLAPSSALAEEQGLGSEAGVGAASALLSLVYGPAKIVYAGLGLIVGGIAWGLAGGDGEVMAAVVTPAVRGDYVVTPAVLRMQRSLEFYGRDPRYRTSQHATMMAEDL
jgi:hypothetical protein